MKLSNPNSQGIPIMINPQGLQSTFSNPIHAGTISGDGHK
jgi:hypothetical protein